MTECVCGLRMECSASDDKRYGLEYLNRVTITINKNVKLNSLMRAAAPLPSLALAPSLSTSSSSPCASLPPSSCSGWMCRVPASATGAGRCVPDCASTDHALGNGCGLELCGQRVGRRVASDAVLSPRGRPTSGRTASGNGCARASVDGRRGRESEGARCVMPAARTWLRGASDPLCISCVRSSPWALMRPQQTMHHTLLTNAATLLK